MKNKLAGAPKAIAIAPALPAGAKTIPISVDQAALLAQLNQKVSEAQNVLTVSVNMILASKGVGSVLSVGLAGSPKAPSLAYIEARKKKANT